MSDETVYDSPKAEAHYKMYCDPRMLEEIERHYQMTKGRGVCRLAKKVRIYKRLKRSLLM